MGSLLFPWRSTPAAACQDALAEVQKPANSGGGAYTYSLTYVGETGCAITRSDGGVLSYDVLKSAAMCPDNSTASGTTCVCSSGFVEKNGQCISAQDPDMKCATDFAMAGFGIGQGLGTIRDTKTVSGVVPSGEMCWPHESATSGCLVIFDRSSLTTMPDGSIQSGGSFSMYKGGVGGKACTLEELQDPGSTVEEKCEQSGSYTDSKGTHSLCLDPPKCEGGYGGEVNGVEVCVRDKGGNVIETEKISETTNSDGSKDKVTEKTTCKGNTCTTEKTTTNTTSNNTSSSSTTTKTESKEDYCKSNASAAQCKDDEEKEGSFGGSCQGGFTCEGDALQCAQLKEQHKRNCEMMEKDTDANSLTNKALNGTDDKSADALKASAGQVNVSSTFDQSGLGWSHSCPADPRIPLGFGGSNSEFSIPFSRICGPLGVLSLAGVGITLLGCGVWVLGGKKEG